MLDLVRAQATASAVRAVLGASRPVQRHGAGREARVRQGCELQASSGYSWPQWSHDAATAQKIEAAKKRALTLAAG